MHMYKLCRVSQFRSRNKGYRVTTHWNSKKISYKIPKKWRPPARPADGLKKSAASPRLRMILALDGRTDGRTDGRGQRETDLTQIYKNTYTFVVCTETDIYL